MLKLCMLGGGGHSRANHLPALRRYVARHPGEVELAGFCDLDAATATRIASEFAFARAYSRLDEMLAEERPDACIAITPVNATAEIATTILNAGVPLLMEKPPGATLAENAQLCALVERLSSRAMVSMNRRFDPALAAARAWVGDRPIRHIRASMFRHARREPSFISETAIHCVDAVRHLAGDVRSHAATSQVVDGVRWYHLELAFTSGATGTIDIAPTCGSLAETYELFGDGFHATARIAEFDVGTITTWSDGGPASDVDPTVGQPPFVRNGTYAETKMFLDAVRAGRPLSPTPADVRQSLEICHQIAEQFRAAAR